MCVQKSKYVTYSSAFSSRYAKTRTSNFRKVVRQHTEGMVGSTTWVLLEIYLAFQQWKNFESPLRIDKVIAMSSVCSFFWPTLYIDDWSLWKLSADVTWCGCNTVVGTLLICLLAGQFVAGWSPWPLAVGAIVTEASTCSGWVLLSCDARLRCLCSKANFASAG